MQAAPSKPNILFILIDDMGWKDIACQGNPYLTTPNIDQFAEEGMRFTDAYASAPVCSPTRAAILTGHSPARLQITNHLPHQDRFTPEDSKLHPAEMRDHLPFDRLMFGSDFPHSVGSYPNSQQFLNDCFDGVDESYRRMMLLENPARYYGLDLDADITETPAA